MCITLTCLHPLQLRAPWRLLRGGRTVPLCRADGVDLSAAMAEDGWAFAFVRYSRDYMALEEKARSENVGLHPFHCELPWEWRCPIAREQVTNGLGGRE